MGALIQFLILLVIAGVCGSLGMALAGRQGRKGCLLSIAVGFIGALLGRLLSEAVGLPDIFTIGGYPVIWSIIGGALFVAVLSLIAGRR